MGRIRRRLRSPHEGGFTLIELLVAIVITTVIIGALGQAIFVGLSDSSSTTLRLTESHDSELAARFFAGDVAGVSGTVTTATGATTCSSLTSTTNLLTMPLASETGTEPAGAQTSGTSTWELEPPTGSPAVCEMVRVLTGIATSTVVIGREVVSVAAPTCSPSCSNPQTISMIVTELQNPQDPNLSHQYSYTLNGTVRQSGAGGSTPSIPTPTPPAILTLATSGASVTTSGSGTLVAGGPVVVNSNATGAIGLSGSASLTASAGTYSLGTCASSGSAVCPGVTHLSAVDPDPLAALPTPSTAGLSTYSGSTDQGCGIYTGTLSVSGSATMTLNSANKPDCVYYLENGITASGSATLTAGSNGVLIYIAGGGFTCSGSASCNLAPIGDPANQYYGILLFQSRSDSTSASLSGSGTINSYGGIVYAPNVAVAVSGSAGLTVRAIICKTLGDSGSGTVTVI